ncbi:MAG: hypothetical protein LBC03_07130 [Nitrososphaerota archaeon]|jgi:radical SAM enzyme (TIGR01210 family)|nr:hypothetical protein [Nitrososphaerota archaeon]
MRSFESDNICDYVQELERIKNVAKYLRSLKTGNETEWKAAAEWHLKYGNLNGQQVLALTITLSPTGCEWARQGGCTMCGEFEGALKRTVLIENPQFHIAQFVCSMVNNDVWKAVRKEAKNISWLRIVQEGNYTNINEMNSFSQQTILKLATKFDGIRRVTIESRPQYLCEDTVSVLAEIFTETDVELEIGMGVEAQNEIVRNVCVNKQNTKEQFMNAVNLLKSYNVKPLAYILIKPPFLTEQEAIDEAVATAHFAVSIGFERISFEPMSIHANTVVEALTQTGDYKTPWLWSVIEVAKQCADITKYFGIGGVGYYPIPMNYAHNYCDDTDDCNKKVCEAIKNYNESRDVSCLSELSCSCQTLWKKDCTISSLSLKKRIQEQLTRVEQLLPTYQAKELPKNCTMRDLRIIASGAQHSG